MLVVDDDKFERDGVKFLVNKYGLQLNLVEADSGEKALDYIVNRGVDILFTDIRMKGMDGLELAEKAVELGRPIKVIFMSAYGEFEYAQRAIDLKAIRYILKPVEVNEFLKVVSQVIQLCEDERKAKDQHERMEQMSRMERRFEKQKIVSNLIRRRNDAGDDAEELNLSMIPAGFHPGARMIMLDTRTRFFDLLDLDFEQSLKEIVLTKHDLVHLNECQSLLIVESHAEEKGELQLFGERIIHWFKATYDRDVTVVIGGVLNETKTFDEQFGELELILENKFFCDEGAVLFGNPTSFVSHQDQYSLDEALAELTQNIRRVRYDIARLQFQQMIEALHNSDQYSVIYVKYLCSEIIKAVFDASTLKDASSFKETLDQVYKTTQLGELNAVVSSVLAEHEPSGSNATDSMRKVIEDAVRIIEEEYHTDLSLESLAERVYLSPSYFSHLFRQEKGIGINKYITSYRMEQARRMLLTTNQKIVTISHQVGYSNFPYFSTLFKTHYGKTPTQYREESGK
ncbi:response regulator transcription factor [Paenibacillus mendelii]|uniref:Response regulator n=1 Tax=Paenibacillus mendelii TaxID=206163 RepID=A0ABV6JPE7_9BACL|nr:response regulator [Paenibacillus mendelii]MCQ6563070.1 response regulator [Paenibacillus mendelii]